MTSRYRCDALTNWAMKPLMLGAGHLWVLMSPWRMDVRWYMKGLIYWTADLKSSKLWSSQLWTQFKQLRIESGVQYMNPFIYHFTVIIIILFKLLLWDFMSGLGKVVRPLFFHHCGGSQSPNLSQMRADFVGSAFCSKKIFPQYSVFLPVFVKR